jgi:hypothetical protein
MAKIRPFRPDDIPDVVALRRKSFKRSERPAAAVLEAYFEQVFFRNPWRDEALPSLVYMDSSGRPVGFLGVVPRRATFHDEALRVAVSTQLMTDPEHRGVAALGLIKALFAGGQDICLADVANDVSRRLWEGLGGAAALVPSLTWTQPLRAVHYFGGLLAETVGARALAVGLRPLAWAVDRFAPTWLHRDGLRADPLTPEAMATHLPELLQDVALRPVYDATALAWLLEQLAAKRALGELRSAALWDPEGGLVGWYLYYANRGGVGQVVQVVAAKGRYGAVAHAMFHDAWHRGLTALAGRLEPQLVPMLAERDGAVIRTAPWVLVQSPRADVLAAIQRGDAFLSRLEGEWWLSF